MARRVEILPVRRGRERVANGPILKTLVVFSGLMAWQGGGHAEDCAASAATTTAAATGCIELNSPARSSADDAALLRFDGFDDGSPWIAQGAKAGAGDALPLDVTPKDNGAGYAMRASAKAWRDYNDKMTAKRIEAAKSLAAKPIAVPKTPVTTEPPLDVWSTLEVQNGTAGVEGSSRTGVGADYTVSRKTKIGVAAERGATATADDDKVSAYFAYQALPALSVDTRAQWEAETGDPAAPKSEKSSVIVAPRLSQPFVLEGGTKLEPFVTYKQEIDVSTSGVDGAGTTNAVGTGVTLAKPDEYSLSVTTDVENVGQAAPSSVNSKLQLKLPLP